MRQPPRAFLRSLAFEFPLYGLVVVAYILLVLRYLSKPLQTAFTSHRAEYAATALGLILGQALVLELVTRGLGVLVARRRRRKA